MNHGDFTEALRRRLSRDDIELLFLEPARGADSLFWRVTVKARGVLQTYDVSVTEGHAHCEVTLENVASLLAETVREPDRTRGYIRAVGVGAKP